MPPEAPANQAVANAVMQPAADAATPIAQPQRRKLQDLTKMVHGGEMPGLAYDPAARAPMPDNAPRTDDAPLFADEVETGEGELVTMTDPASLALDDSHDAEVMDPAEYERIRAMFDAPELAEPLLDKLVSAPGPDGKPWKVSVRQCIRGYLREEDYSRKNADLSARENAVRTARAGLERLLTQMDSSEGFINAVRVLQKWGTEPDPRMGRPGTGFMGACFIVGEQLAAEMVMRDKNPQAYAEMVRRREYEQRLFAAEQRALQAENAAQQAVSQQQPQPDQEAQRTMHQLEQLMPRALQVARVQELSTANEAFALEWKVNSEKLFALHWQHLLPTLAPEQLESGPSMDFVQLVVNATVQSCQKRAAEMGRPVANPNAPPPGQGLTGAPTRQGQPGSNGMPKRAKIGDMGKILGTFR